VVEQSLEPEPGKQESWQARRSRLYEMAERLERRLKPHWRRPWLFADTKGNLISCWAEPIVFLRPIMRPKKTIFVAVDGPAGIEFVNGRVLVYECFHGLLPAHHKVVVKNGNPWDWRINNLKAIPRDACLFKSLPFFPDPPGLQELFWGATKTEPFGPVLPGPVAVTVGIWRSRIGDAEAAMEQYDKEQGNKEHSP